VFTEWMNRGRLTEERRRTARALTAVDLLTAAGLFVEALAVAPERPLYAVLMIALALGIALAAVLMEPATTAAAFSD
jgi:hypothetical protein